MHLGLIGQNIAYSLSPTIHLFSAKELGISCSYKIFDLKSSQLPKFIESFYNLGGIGLNVTKPYKQAVAKLTHSKLDSVNTLHRQGHKWVGCSTDGPGFIRGLNQTGFAISSFEHVIILGAGGVVPSLLTSFQESGVNLQVSLLRRNSSNDTLLSSYQNKKIQIENHPFQAPLLESLIDPNRKTLVIQATSAPLNGYKLSEFFPYLEHLNGCISELCYGVPSALIEAANYYNIPHQDGLPMLVEQAKLAQELWWGQSADSELILKHLRSIKS